MYQIPIDDLNYHINHFSNKEYNWIDSVYSDTIKHYPTLKIFIQSNLSSLNLTSTGIKHFMRKVLLAFCHTIQRDFPVNTREQLCKTVKKWLMLFLPTIVSNEKVFYASHCVQYEPKVLVSLAFSDYFNNRSIISKISELGEGSFEHYYFWECINLTRAIRSSMILFTVGDDVHGVCNYRGSLEILAKLALADNFKDEYVKFKNFNANLQYKKMNDTPLPQDMIDYLSEYPEYKTNPENFLAYGWAKDSKNQRVMTLKSLVQTAFPEQENYYQWVHFASEFIHEDYVAVNYDYIGMRKNILDYYYVFYIILLDITKEFYTKEERKQNGFNDIKHLFSTISEIYKIDIEIN